MGCEMSGVRLSLKSADGHLVIAYDEEFAYIVAGLKLLLAAAQQKVPVEVDGALVDVRTEAVTKLLSALQFRAEQSKNYIT